jgi:OmpA-OmpF porin, OOP family
MTNVLYDFDLGPYGVPLLPYAGVGVGYAWTSLRGLSATGTNFPYLLRSNATASNFAYQVIGGLAFPVPNVPGLAITAEYRFFSVIGSERFDASYIVPPPRGFGENFGKLKFPAQYNHAALLGVRYAFNAAAPLPPPAPVQAPAPAPARSYLVFFDWDRADLTDRARQIIAEAAQNSTRVQYTRIQVNGYTDTSGTPAYNQRLSVRHAESVAAELVRDGVPRSEISIQGFGETHLLVPTGPGVREPQNRRVEIIIQ